MKFNVGDKMVEIKDGYYKNPFHYDKTVSTYVVGSADEAHFSISNRLSLSGSDSGITYSQNDGWSRDGRTRVYHQTKDHDAIQNILLKILDRYDTETDADVSNVLIRLEQQKAAIAEKIESIKNGNRYFPLGFSEYNVKSFRDDLELHMKKKLGIKEIKKPEF